MSVAYAGGQGEIIIALVRLVLIKHAHLYALRGGPISKHDSAIYFHTNSRFNTDAWHNLTVWRLMMFKK